ncbi:MAG: hypothetical protein B7X53_14390 [Hyphomonas sp. 34-62-18]|nr:MAG: hypothetical protein B7X53_14390 [Hyphomonas sp. 34-62-18]
MKIALAAIGAALTLAACGKADEQAAPKITSKQDTEIAVSTGDKDFDATMRCWALTNTAYFVHIALGDGQTGNLPNPDASVYGIWHKKLSIMAYDKKMSLDAFQEMMSEAKSSVAVYSVEVEPEYAAAVQKCIDTTPPPIDAPDPSWP